MAYLVDATYKLETTPFNTTVVLSDQVQENDLIVVQVMMRLTFRTVSITGYTKLDTERAQDAYTSIWFYKIAGASESDPTITVSGTTGNYTTHIYTHVFRDVDTTTPINGNAYSGFSGASGTSPTLTTSTDNCVILHGAVWDTTAVLETFDALNPFVGGLYSREGIHLQESAGAIPTFTYYGSNASNGCLARCIAINNATGGTLPVRMDDGRTYLTTHGYETVTTAAPNSVSGLASIQSIPMGSNVGTYGFAVPTASDWGQYGASIGSAENLATASWVGIFHNKVADLTGKLLVVPYGIGGTFDASRVGAYGSIMVLVDSSDNWVAYQLRSQDNSQINQGYVQVINPGVTPVFDESASPIDFSDIAKFGHFYHRQAGTTTSVGIYIGCTYVASPSVLVGGSATWPITPIIEDRMIRRGGASQNVYATNSQSSRFQGAGQLILRLPVQYGDGTNKTVVSKKTTSTETPSASDVDWRAGENATSIVLYGSADCRFDFSSSILGSSTRQAFGFNQLSSTSAYYNFNGCSLTGFDVEWRTGVTANGLLLSNCYTVQMHGADMSGCTVSTPQESSALSFDEPGATIDGTTIDLTGSNADYHIELGTAVDAITLTDVAFTGTPGTNKIHVLASSGTVTITIDGTTSLVSGDVTSEGATVVIDAPTVLATAQVLGLVAGSRVRIYNVTTDTEIFNDIVVGTSYSDDYITGTDYSADDVVQVRVAYSSGTTAYLPAQYSTVATASGWTILAEQETDAVYEYNGIDGDTVTEFTADYPNVQIDVSDPDGVTTVQRGYAWYISGQMTADGIRYYHGSMVAEDAFNYRIVTSVADMQLDNVVATPVQILGGRLYRDDGGQVIADGSGSIQMEYGRTYALETGVSGLTAPESAQLMALSDAEGNAAAVLAAAQSTPIQATSQGRTLEGTITEGEALRIILAAMAGKRQGLGTATEEYLAQDGVTPRITFAPSDAAGNGTTVVDGS